MFFNTVSLKDLQKVSIKDLHTIKFFNTVSLKDLQKVSIKDLNTIKQLF